YGKDDDGHGEEGGEADRLAGDGPAEEDGNDGGGVGKRGRASRVDDAQQPDVGGEADERAEDEQGRQRQDGAETQGRRVEASRLAGGQANAAERRPGGEHLHAAGEEWRGGQVGAPRPEAAHRP